MATTTTNYGFDVPTSSDLVKNGATQIALLGQDLDTFLFRPFTRNGVLNGSLNVWQRGTSISLAASTTAASGYSADRWDTATGANQAVTISRQSTNDTTNLPNIQYCARYQRNSGQTGTGALTLAQSFESVNSIPYAGKTVTFSFYARSGANYSPTSSLLNVYVWNGTGTDQNIVGAGFTGQNAFINSSATLTTTWQRFTFSATVPTNATQIATGLSFTPTGTASTNDYFEVTGVQLEVGNQASPYAPATPTYATELAACQRYYYRNSPNVTGYPIFGSGLVSSATTGYPSIALPVPMRIAPTAVEGSGTAAHYYLISASATIIACSAVPTFLSATIYQVQLQTTVTAGLISGNITNIGSNNTASSFLGFSAEL